jgi:hypothetical protein
MAQLPFAGTEATCLAPPLCPECHAPLTDKLVCWACCDRLCSACGHPTGSAFIEVCMACEASTLDAGGVDCGGTTT